MKRKSQRRLWVAAAVLALLMIAARSESEWGGREYLAWFNSHISKKKTSLGEAAPSSIKRVRFDEWPEAETPPWKSKQAVESAEREARRSANKPAPGRRIVTTRPGFDPKKFEKFARVEHLGGERSWLVYSENDALIRSVEGVVSVELDYPIWVEDTAPNDPEYWRQWGLKNTQQYAGALPGIDIGAEQAWDSSTGERNVIVAILDTGMDRTHPDLADNAWVNFREFYGEAGVDDDGNGKIDDIHGWDFVNDDADPSDDNGHGTHCAGIIGAVGNNGIGVSGVCWDCNLLPIKVLDDTGFGYTSASTAAIYYAVDTGARIISNSYGGTSYSQARQDAIAYAESQGVLFVASAGNDGQDNDVIPHWPSNSDRANVIAVANMTVDGSLYATSNYGDETVDIAAPGRWIYSTAMGGGYEFRTGTSMAAPHVAGVAALAWSKNSQLTLDELVLAIRTRVVSGQSLIGLVDTGGHSELNLVLLDSENGTSERQFEKTSIGPGDPYGSPFFVSGRVFGDWLNGTYAVAKAADYLANDAAIWVDDGSGVGGSARDLKVNGSELRDIVLPDQMITDGVFVDVGGNLAMLLYDLDSPDTPNHDIYLWVDDGLASGIAGNFMAEFDELRSLSLSTFGNPHAIGTPQIAIIGGNVAVCVPTMTVDSGSAESRLWIDDGFGGGIAGDLMVNGAEIRLFPGQQVGGWFSRWFLHDHQGDALIVMRHSPYGIKLWRDDGWQGGVAGNGIGEASEVRLIDLQESVDFLVNSESDELEIFLLGQDAWGFRLWRDDGAGGSNNELQIDAGELEFWGVVDWAGFQRADFSTGSSLGKLKGRYFAGLYRGSNRSLWIDDGAGLGESNDQLVHDDEIRSIADQLEYGDFATVRSHGNTLLATGLGFDVDPIEREAQYFRYRRANRSPFADAGADIVQDDENLDGIELIQLDGTQSTGVDDGIWKYVWHVNGQELSGPNPTVELTPGTYTATLQVYDDSIPSFVSAVDEVQITVTAQNIAPVAVLGDDISVVDIDNDGWEYVVIDASSSYDPDGSIHYWNWHNSSGFAGTAPNLFGYWYPVGVTQVWCTVYDSGNPQLTGVDQITITVTEPVTVNQAPIANAGADQTITDHDGNGTQGTVLSGLSSTDPDGSIVRYEWSIAGQIIGVGPQVAAQLPVGNTVVTLKVFDDGVPQMTSTDVLTVTVLGPGTGNQAPIAVAGSDFSVTDADGDGGQGFVLYGGASSDPDGTITKYEWLIDGSIVGVGQYAAIRTDVGTTTITLKVYDNGTPKLTATDTIDVTVDPPGAVNQAPTADGGADITVYDTDDSGSEGFVIGGSGSSDPDGTITRYEWIYNSSVVAVGQNAAFSLPTGNHTLTLKVYDNGTPKLTGTDTVEVSVVAFGALPNLPPVADAGSDFIIQDTDGDGEQGFVLWGHGSSDPDGNIAYAEWRLGSGGPLVAKGLAAAVVYPVGVYTFELYVRDDGSPTLTAVDTIEVTIDPQGGGSAEGGFDIDPPPGNGAEGEIDAPIGIESEADAPQQAEADPADDIAVGLAPYTVQITDRARSLEEGVALLTWEYDWDGDGVWDASSPESGTLTHVFRRPGTYTVRQRVMTETGGAAIATRRIEILAPPDPPTVTGVAVVVRSSDGATLELTPQISGSHPVDTVFWDFDEDGRWDATSDGNGAIEHDFLRAGAHVVSVMYRDARGVDSQVFRHELQISASRIVRVNDPLSGVSVSGNGLTVRSSVYPGGALNSYVRVKGTVAWHLVPTVSSVDGLVVSRLDLGAYGEGTQLEIQARTQATDESGEPYVSPVVTLTVDSGSAAIREEVLDDGRIVRTVNLSASESILSTDRNGVSIMIPVGAIDAGSLRVRTEQLSGARHPMDSGSVADEGLHSAATHVAVDVFDGADSIHVPDAPLVLRIPYEDADDDGIVDGTAVPEGELSVHWFDEENGKWCRVPDVVVDVEDNIVIARIIHLTDYGLFSGGPVRTGGGSAGLGRRSDSGACLLGAANGTGIVATILWTLFGCLILALLRSDRRET